MVWRSIAQPEIFNICLKSYHCHVVTVKKISCVFFILGTGLEVFNLGLLWVSRCGDVSRGYKITAAGVRGAGAVSFSGLQLCTAELVCTWGRWELWGWDSSWEELEGKDIGWVLWLYGDDGCSWCFLKWSRYVLLGGVYHLLAVLERN